MAYFKAKLQRTDVTGKVKGHFKSHMEFMCLVGEKVLIEQGIDFFEKFDIQNKDINMNNKFEILNEILDLFLTEYHYIPHVFNTLHWEYKIINILFYCNFYIKYTFSWLTTAYQITYT